MSLTAGTAARNDTLRLGDDKSIYLTRVGALFCVRGLGHGARLDPSPGWDRHHHWRGGILRQKASRGCTRDGARIVGVESRARCLGGAFGSPALSRSLGSCGHLRVGFVDWGVIAGLFRLDASAGQCGGRADWRKAPRSLRKAINEGWLMYIMWPAS